jgi:hypothetical protein
VGVSVDRYGVVDGGVVHHNDVSPSARMEPVIYGSPEYMVSFDSNADTSILSDIKLAQVYDRWLNNNEMDALALRELAGPSAQLSVSNHQADLAANAKVTEDLLTAANGTIRELSDHNEGLEETVEELTQQLDVSEQENAMLAAQVHEMRKNSGGWWGRLLGGR